MSDKKEDVKPNNKEVISEDRQKLGNFYNFTMDDSKLKEIKKRSTKQMGRFAITGVVFGFFT
jgi:hypothetical protein